MLLLTAKFHRPKFNRLEVIVLTNKQTPLKTSTSLRYATPVGNNPQLECERMSNVMVVLPNIGGALCSMPQSLADAHY